MIRYKKRILERQVKMVEGLSTCKKLHLHIVEQFQKNVPHHQHLLYIVLCTENLDSII